MPEQGNKKFYIGDVVVNEDNEKYQRQFFEDVIKTFFGHGNGLDADTVDGYHAYCFATAEQGRKADNSLQSPLSIGTKTNLRNITETGYQWIWDEGIKINQDFIQDDIIKTFKKLNIGRFEDYFAGKTEDDLNEGPNSAYATNLEIILPGIWKILQKQLEGKVDKKEGYDLSQNDFTDEYKNKVDIFSKSIKTIKCEEGIEKQVLDADAVNGLQFFLVTQEQYDALADVYKNCWQNIYILVDETPDGYESPALCTFKSGYEFMIQNCQMYYKSIQAQEWNVMYTYDDLQAIFDCHVMKSLEGKEAPNLENEDYLNYPFISSNLISEFVNSVECTGTYTYKGKKEDVNILFDETTDAKTKFTKVNLFNLYKTFQEKIHILSDKIDEGSDNAASKDSIADIIAEIKKLWGEIGLIKEDVNEKITNIKENYVTKVDFSLLKNSFDTFVKNIDDYIFKYKMKNKICINVDNVISGYVDEYYESIPKFTIKKGEYLYISLADGNSNVDGDTVNLYQRGGFMLIGINGVTYWRDIVPYDGKDWINNMGPGAMGRKFPINLNPGTYECYIVVPDMYLEEKTTKWANHYTGDAFRCQITVKN